MDKFLLAGGRFMPEIHLSQPEFIYSACEPFTKNKEQMLKFREMGDYYIYKNKLDKVYFQYDMV